MAYIGNSPANVGNYQIVDDISGSFNGSTTSFALASGSITITPAKSGQLLIGVNGVMQEPDDTSTNGFKVSGSNIVFSSAPASGDTFWAVYQGQSVDIGTPSDDVVDTIHIKDNAITADKIAAGAVIADVADDSITNAMMADNAIDSDQITSGAVDDAHIADVAATKLTGTIAAARLSTATTQSASDNSTKISTTAYTDTAISNLVDSSPTTLNTLNELAAALGDDANYATTTATSLGEKLPKAGGAMTGAITTNSTFDGRDVATDGTKLDTIATSANLYVHPNHSGDVVSAADGAMTIQTDAVDIAMLSASGTASSTTFLRGDNTWDVPIGGVTSVNSVTGAVTAAHLKTALENGIDSVHYVDGSIDNEHIADDAIDSEHYAAASIDNEHLADDAVGVAELSATGTASSSTFLRGDNAWVALSTDANTTTKGLYEHEHTIDADYSIASGSNAMSAGPITIDTGNSVTVPTGSTWVIV